MIVCSTSVGLISGLWGQRPNPEFLDFNSPESWAMKYFTSASILSSYSPPPKKDSGSLDLILEIVEVPELGDSYRRVGFNSTKLEDLNKAPILLRPVLNFYIKPSVSFTISYAPPIEAWDVTPNLLAGSLNWTVVDSSSWRLGLKLYGQVGSVEGDFTCPESVVAAGDDPILNPFGCDQVSSDTAHLDYYGIEASAAYHMEKLNGLTTFFAIEVTHLDNEFDINSRLFGEPDIRTQVSSGDTFNISGGMLYPVTDKIQFGVQVFYAPLDVIRFGKSQPENDSLINVRFQLSYAFGHIGKWWGK